MARSRIELFIRQAVQTRFWLFLSQVQSVPPTMSILTKNVTLGLASPMNESPTGEMKQLGSNASISPWALMAVTCILLGISGGVRFWRDLKYRTLAQESTVCPFPLKDLPNSMGSWHAVEGSDGKLDPDIARLAGSTDHIIRTYEDKKTGEQVTALVLYGLADSVFGHIPEICYPASGFQQSVASVNQQFSIPGSTTSVQYRSACFTKSLSMVGIGQSEEAEVCYTFRHNGEWLPELASRWKSFRYHPAMFKIQLQRRASGLAIQDKVTESLLSHLVQEIDSRVSQNKTQIATVATSRQ
jgi:hypothetical protein